MSRDQEVEYPPAHCRCNIPAPVPGKNTISHFFEFFFQHAALFPVFKCVEMDNSSAFNMGCDHTENIIPAVWCRDDRPIKLCEWKEFTVEGISRKTRHPDP